MSGKPEDVESLVRQKLVETGEMAKLKDFINTRLIECGWYEKMKAHSKKILKKRGVDSPISNDELLNELKQKGQAMVPVSVKQELVRRVRTFLAQHFPELKSKLKRIELKLE